MPQGSQAESSKATEQTTQRNGEMQHWKPSALLTINFPGAGAGLCTSGIAKKTADGLKGFPCICFKAVTYRKWLLWYTSDWNIWQKGPYNRVKICNNKLKGTAIITGRNQERFLERNWKSLGSIDHSLWNATLHVSDTVPVAYGTFAVFRYYLFSK